MMTPTQSDDKIMRAGELHVVVFIFKSIKFAFNPPLVSLNHFYFVRFLINKLSFFGLCAFFSSNEILHFQFLKLFNVF